MESSKPHKQKRLYCEFCSIKCIIGE